MPSTFATIGLRKGERMITLSWWQEFIITTAISVLTLLESKLKNATEVAALKAAVQFLTSLVSGTVAAKGN